LFLLFRQWRSSFFNYFYFTINIGALVSSPEAALCTDPAQHHTSVHMHSAAPATASCCPWLDIFIAATCRAPGTCIDDPLICPVPVPQVASTVVVGVQEVKGYGVGFGIPTAAFMAAICLFVAGAVANLYTRVPPEGSPFRRIFRVFRGE
jgi:dipeptide/tripeptide permease